MGKKVNNKEPKYAYAYDEERKLVHISALTKDSRDGHIYKCLSCGSVMIPRLGDINIHHFAHKVDVECNNETYLHILSKEILRKRFYSSDSFEISLYQTAKCDLYERCPIQKADEECIREVLEPYDLKKYYCNCLLEDWDPITKKRPDLKLVSNNPQREPIWIEIYVTNPCSDDKIQKNRRIIEIKIETEEQAKSLMTAKIKETPHNYNEVSWDSWNEDSLTINFYNFERNKDLIKPFTCESKGKPIATLLKTGYVQMKKMPCREKEVRFSEGEVAAIILDKDRGDRASLWEKAAFAKYGIGNFKSCLWCMGYRKDYGKTYCYYGKDLGIIGPPKENHAYFCDWRYDPCFSSELPDVVLNKRFTPEQARAMMKNHPKTPTTPPYYQPIPPPVVAVAVPPSSPQVVITKSEFYIPYYDESLLPFIADISNHTKGEIYESQRLATAINNVLNKDKRTKDWAISNASATRQGDWPCLVFDSNIGKYRILCQDPWNNRIFVGYRFFGENRCEQIFKTDNHDCIVDSILNSVQSRSADTRPV